MDKMLQLKCTICLEEFIVKPYRKDAKFCSQKCYGDSIKGKIPKSAFKKGVHRSLKTEFKKGKKHPYYGKSSPAKGKHWKLSKKTKELMSIAQSGKTHDWNLKGISHPTMKGELNPFWKGDDVSYRNLHRWKERHSGKPTTCEDCGRTGLIGRQIHWANKSGNYLRKLDDWRRLCCKCHKAYDKKLRLQK